MRKARVGVMTEFKQVVDLFAGTGGLAVLLVLGALVLVAVVVLAPSREPHRRLVALVRAWHGPGR